MSRSSFLQSLINSFRPLQAVEKKGIIQPEGEVMCRNIKNLCPKTSCEHPVLLPDRCCKTCPGTDAFESHTLGFSSPHSSYPAPGIDNKQDGLDRPKFLQITDANGNVLFEKPIQKRRKGDKKLCGVWRKIPPIYVQYFRQERLFAVITASKYPDGLVAGRIVPNDMASTEVFGSVLSSPTADGIGGLASFEYDPAKKLVKYVIYVDGMVEAVFQAVLSGSNALEKNEATSAGSAVVELRATNGFDYTIRVVGLESEVTRVRIEGPSSKRKRKLKQRIVGNLHRQFHSDNSSFDGWANGTFKKLEAKDIYNLLNNRLYINIVTARHRIRTIQWYGNHFADPYLLLHLFHPPHRKHVVQPRMRGCRWTSDVCLHYDAFLAGFRHKNEIEGVGGSFSVLLGSHDNRLHEDHSPDEFVVGNMYPGQRSARVSSWSHLPDQPEEDEETETEKKTKRGRVEPAEDRVESDDEKVLSILTASRVVKDGEWTVENHPDVLLNLARVLFNLQYLDDAIFLTRRSLEMQPSEQNSWLQHYTLGEILKAYGHYQEATLHFRHCLELNPDFQPAIAHLREMEGTPSPSVTQYTLFIILFLVLGVLFGVVTSIEANFEDTGEVVKTQRHFNRAMAMRSIKLGINHRLIRMRKLNC
nr:hypothetical protein BaRGS_006569 [Batillaria attramentaria]